MPCADRRRPATQASPGTGANHSPGPSAESGVSADPDQDSSVSNKTKRRKEGLSSVCCVSITAEAPMVLGVVTGVVAIDAKGQGPGRGVGVGVVVRWAGEEEDKTYPVSSAIVAAGGGGAGGGDGKATTVVADRVHWTIDCALVPADPSMAGHVYSKGAGGVLPSEEEIEDLPAWWVTPLDTPLRHTS